MAGTGKILAEMPLQILKYSGKNTKNHFFVRYGHGVPMTYQQKADHFGRVWMAEADSFRMISQPNRALSKKEQSRVARIMGAGLLLAGGGWGLAGFWPALAFEGAAAAALLLAFKAVDLGDDDLETLSIEKDEVVSTLRWRGAERLRKMNREWVRLKIGGRGELELWERGVATKVGIFLGEEERASLGKELAGWLKTR